MSYGAAGLCDGFNSYTCAHQSSRSQRRLLTTLEVPKATTSYGLEEETLSQAHGSYNVMNTRSNKSRYWNISMKQEWSPWGDISALITRASEMGALLPGQVLRTTAQLSHSITQLHLHNCNQPRNSYIWISLYNLYRAPTLQHGTSSRTRQFRVNVATAKQQQQGSHLSKWAGGCHPHV